MNSEPHFGRSLRAELSDWQIWQTRVVVLAFAALSGLTVVAFTWLTEHALAGFFRAHAALPWLPLVWTPLCTALVVWATRRWAPGAAGSGIPQVMAALHPHTPPRLRGLYGSTYGCTSLGIHQVTVGKTQVRHINVQLVISSTHIIGVGDHRNELIKQVTSAALIDIVTVSTTCIEVGISVGIRLDVSLYHLYSIIYDVAIETVNE
jgi:hypothetical protein